jgi:threonyl-tRNA synthetase
MKSIRITLPDGSVREYPPGVTPLQIAASIGKKLEADSIAAKVNGVVSDATVTIHDDAQVAIITKNSAEGLEVLRHSTAHLLAHAIKELYPTAQITIGPVIEEGFYYDIDPPSPITLEDLPKIERKMEEIAARKLDVKRTEVGKPEAVQFFRNQQENYKAEIIESIPEEKVSLYTQGDFTDLCRGPHVPNTQRLGKFKLLSVAGAYWRGDEKNKMLQRIYGTAFSSQKELDEHLHRIEEAKRRDHRKLGPELGLFTFMNVAPAMPFYLPKGTAVVNLMREYMQGLTKQGGYTEVICPQLMTTDLWKKSGHWDNYRDNMFFAEAGEDGDSDMCLKPMNCPGHCMLFGSTKRSYRELPIRYTEFSRLHRYERAGVTHGLFRTRSFSQDDGHVFCSEDQIQDEAISVIKDVFRVYKQFGFNEVELRLATRPEKKYIGTPELWDTATDKLAKALQAAGQKFKMAPGEGAFYGPKVEVHIKDSIGRFWQCGTVQLDYFLPERFELEYTTNDNSAKRPVMIHRAILGSIERFMGILIEHHAGHLPVWVAPVQTVVMNVTPDFENYAKHVAQSLDQAGVRVELDCRNEKLGYKIREAQLAKVPFMVILGSKEAETSTISVRRNNGENLNQLSISDFLEILGPLTATREPTGG